MFSPRFIQKVRSRLPVIAGFLVLGLVSVISITFARIFMQESQDVRSQAAYDSMTTPPIPTTPILTPVASPLPTIYPSGICPYLTDIANNDGLVDIYDYTIFVQNFDKSGNDIPGDINCSGKVDVYDYTYLLKDLSM